MARVLVTSAGGRLAVAFTRGLKAAPEPIEVIGVDANRYGLQRAEADKKFQVPWARDDSYVSVINDIIDENKIDLVTVQLEGEMLPMSENRDKLHAPLFLPRHEAIVTCDSKWASYEKWEKAGVAVPKSILIKTREDLKDALEELGGKMWLRGLTGTGGKGSIPVTSVEKAVSWIDLWNGWGNFMAAELLTKETSSWESVWSHGKLVAAQVRKRLYWEFGNLTMSGVTGITGASETVNDAVVERVSRAATLAIDPEPHGIMGVDVAFDDAGTPKVTEINAGRFMSGGVILFASNGFNFPYVAAKTGLGESVDGVAGVTNPFPEGMICIRGLDVEPVITTRERMEAPIKELEQRMAKLKKR